MAEKSTSIERAGTSEVRGAEQTPPTIRVVTPEVDVYENADEFLVLADLPGVAKEALDVSFARGELTLQGTNTHRMYRRVFTLPEGIDAQHIAADLHDGVLTLHLPKAPEVKPRKIEVRAG